MRISILRKMAVAALLSAACLVGMSVAANAQGRQRQERHRKQEEKQHRKQERRNAHRAQQRRRRALARNHGNHFGRIPDNRYRAHFGRAHEFRMVRPRMVHGYNRFVYSGYRFGFRGRWPAGWRRTDRVYVEYARGGYYLCDPRHPSIRIMLTIF